VLDIHIEIKPNDGVSSLEFYGYILVNIDTLSIEKQIQIRSRRMNDRRAIDERLRAINGTSEC
jgi:hypothetical protein